VSTTISASLVKELRDATGAGMMDCKRALVETGGDPGHAPARALYGDVGFTPLPIARYFRLLD